MIEKPQILRVLYAGKQRPEQKELTEMLGHYYYAMALDYTGPAANGGKHNDRPNLAIIDMKDEDPAACEKLVGRLRAQNGSLQIVVLGNEKHHNLMLAAGASHCMGEADRANVGRVAQQIMDPEEAAEYKASGKGGATSGKNGTPSALQPKPYYVTYVGKTIPTQKNLREMLGDKYDGAIVTTYENFPALGATKHAEMPSLLIADIHGQDAGDCRPEIESILKLNKAPKVIVIGEREKYHAFEKLDVEGYLTRPELPSMPEFVATALAPKGVGRK